jgi:hypothetical protein
MAVPKGSGSVTVTKSKVTAPKKVPLTTDLWVTGVIEALNVKLKSQGAKSIPITQNNIDNFERIMTAEVGGQSGGFLRDNNPLNVGTFCGAHGPLYGAAKTIAPYGPDPRCSGGSVYLNIFATPEAGAKGTAAYLDEYGGQLIKVLQQNGPTAMFAAASPWGSSDLGSTPLKETAGSTSAFYGPQAPPVKGKSDTALATKILAWVSSPHKGSNFPAAIEDQFTKLSAADQKATLASVQATLAKQRNLSLAQQVSAAAGGVVTGASSTINTVKSVASDATAVTSFLGDLTSAAFWKRIGIGALGVVLIGAGTIIFLQSTKPVQAAEGAALKVV